MKKIMLGSEGGFFSGDCFYVPIPGKDYFQAIRLIDGDAFRRDPVPGTGKRHRRYNVLKRPQTAQEMRQTYVSPELIRAKRNPRNLPDAYDDVIKTSYDSRSWKNYRRTQYRAT